MTEFSDISMTFDSVGAVRGDHTLFGGLSFEIKSNEVMWIRGDNGIGKTTLLRLAAGLSRPNTGQIYWTHNGLDVNAQDIIAFQGHRNALKSHLSAIEDLDFWAELYDYQDGVAAVLASVGLSDRIHVRCGNLSAGQSRRLAIARLLISGNPLWIMDEPAAAMDTDGQALILGAVNQHVAKGGAAIIASHDTAQTFAGRTSLLTLEAA